MEARSGREREVHLGAKTGKPPSREAKCRDGRGDLGGGNRMGAPRGSLGTRTRDSDLGALLFS